VDQKSGDAGQPPTGEMGDWNELVEEAAVHAKRRADAIAIPDPSPTQSKARASLLGLLTIPLLVVAGWNVYFFTMAGDLPPAYEEVALQASLYLAQQSVEESWKETGSLPVSLDEVGADEEGLSYFLSETGYTITAKGLHHDLSFRRGDDITNLEASFQSLLTGEVRR